MKYVLSFSLGAAAMTAVIVSTGWLNLTLYALGFASAGAVGSLVAWGLGAARLARWFSRLSGVPAVAPALSQAPAARAITPVTVMPAPAGAVAKEVILALVGLNTPRKDARAAVAAVPATVPQQFEPMFRAAVAIVTGRAA